MASEVCLGGCGTICETELPDNPVRIALCMAPRCREVWESTQPPGAWVDVADTMPGGRYDGVWEDSGISLDGGVYA